MRRLLPLATNRVLQLAAKRLLPLAALALAATTASACMQPPADVTVQTGSDGAPVGISVSGHGDASGTPDVLEANVGVAVVEDTVAAAVSKASREASAVEQALERAGIAKRDIQTASYSISPEYASGPQPERKITGYRVSNVLAIKIRDLRSAGDVLDRVASAGGNDVVVSGLRFAIENPAPLATRARDEAWKDAYTKASEIARLAGVRLGPAVSIQEAGGPRPFVMERAIGAAELAPAATPIEPGELKVNVTLQVQFALGGPAPVTNPAAKPSRAATSRWEAERP